jgi:hypothetical protein
VRPGACLSLLLAPCAAAAQTPAQVQSAVNSITAADVRHHIGVLADDSMLGRATPSPQLEQVALYIAAQFRRFGLRPGGDAGSYLQRYYVSQRAVDTSASTIRIAGATSATLKPGRDVYLLRFAPLPTRPLAGPVVLFVGTLDSTNLLAGTDVHGAWAAMLGTATPQGININPAWVASALRAGAIGWMVISNRPDPQWENRLARTTLPTTALEGIPLGGEGAGAAFEIRDATARALLGIDPAALRAQAAGWSGRRLAGVTVRYLVKERELSRASAPNVIGVLQGRDPKLKAEYVFLTGHMDHIGTPGSGEGCVAQGADSICNGADDDASGTTAVIEAAQAFAKLTPRPKRSIVFMTVSGEERGLWGSQYFSEHPTLPLANVVADLNSDMVGRNWKDTIVVIGKEHSDLGTTLNRVAAAHPELRMTPIDDLWPQERFYFRSDHYNFARKGVPILFFFNGTHPDYHQASDSPDKIDAEKETRIIKLVFYLGLEVANAAERPKWNPESYKQIVESARN